MADEQARTGRVPLSRTRIARAAIDLIDAHGLGGLSMRKLGSSLGVEAMSIYHYVANKNELLDLVVAELLTDIEVIDLSGASWETTIRESARTIYELLMAHPDMVPLFTGRNVVATPEGRRVLTRACTVLLDAGFDPAVCHASLHSLFSFVLGHAVETARQPVEAEPIGVVPTDDDTAHEVAEWVAGGGTLSNTELFEFGVDALIQGFGLRYGLSSSTVA